MKIRFNIDNDLPLGKKLQIRKVMINIRSAFNDCDYFV